MKIIKIFRRYFDFFHLIGQSLMIQNRNNVEHIKLKKLIEFMPSITLLAIHLIMVYFETCYHIVSGNDFTDKTSAIIYCCRMIALFLTQLIVVIQIIRFPNEIYQILSAFDQLAWYFQRRLNVIISFDQFKQYYLKRLKIIISCYVLAMILKTIVSLVIKGAFEIHSIIPIVSATFSSFVTIYALFFVDLFNWLFGKGIESIEMHLNDMTFERPFEIQNDKIQTDVLRHSKYIFYKLWRLMKIIERHFGWILFTINIYTVIEILFSLFSTFVAAYHMQESNVIGK